ncbi:class I SAM-dependent methyltransferase [bacterium]|nr:class I SAM-dependent methyltransferase [bacterium]
MSAIPNFDFGQSSVAEVYDSGLVPILFMPWAANLISQHGPWEGKSVLDLAAGTGVVSSILGRETGRLGEVVSADINDEMLRIAKRKCHDLEGNFTFVCCSADSLQCPDASFDSVVCQQGFQFFPDKKKSAKEMFRVLKPGGKALVSTWLSVEKCSYFGALCKALEDIGEKALSDKMRVPFDYMPANELKDVFDSAGFHDVRIEQVEIPLMFPKGIEEALTFAYSTPISGQLKAFSQTKQDEFESRLKMGLQHLEGQKNVFGSMHSHVLTAIR